MKHCCICMLIYMFVAFSSCRKDPPLLPDCIQSAINRISATSQAGTYVKEYSFQKRRVWVFDQLQGEVDGTVPVIDQNCDTLGWLGGYTNLNTINGEDFSNATYISMVYSK